MPQAIPPSNFELAADTVWRQHPLSGSYLCTCEIRNLETGAGLFMYAALQDEMPGGLTEGKYIGPGESYIVRAEDTSITKSGSKIVTQRIWIRGVALGAVTCEIDATGRSGQQIQKGTDGEDVSV